MDGSYGVAERGRERDLRRTGFTRHILVLGVSLGALCPLASFSAAAQDGARSSDAPASADTIVVTARVNNRVSVGKSDALLIETPQSVSVVDSTFIQTINTKTLSESLGYTPGMITQSASFARAADNVYLRGFPVNTADGGILLDGLKPQSSTYGGGIEPYSLERLEVLRGATSVLYGQLGPGGVINAVSKRPSFSKFGEILVQYGSFDRFEVAADYTGPISDDIAFRVTGLIRDSNTDVDYIRDNKRFIAPAITWNISDATELTLLASYQEIRMNFAAPLSIQLVTGAGLPRGPIARDRFVGEPEFDHYDANQWNAGYRLSHALSSNLSIEHALRYYEGELDWDYLQVGAVTAAGVLSRTISSRREKTTSLSTDTRAKADFQTGTIKHELMLGLDIYVPTYRFDGFRNGSVASINIYDPVYGAIPVVDLSRNRGSDIRSRQIGVYFQDQMKIGGNWTVVAGGRQDWSRSRSRSRATGVDTEQKDDAFTWRAGVVHVGDNGIAPYISYSRSFTPQIGTDFNGESFIPSEGEQYEAGIRYQKPSSKMLLSAAVYQLTQTNVLTTDNTPGRPAGFSVQTGEIRVRGVEAEAQARVAENLNLLFAYAWFDSKITRSNIASEVGQRPTFVPRQTISVFADYRLSGIGLPDVKFGGGARYTGNSNIIGANFNNKAYTLVDAFVEWTPGDWRVAFNARNLFNKKYAACLSAGVNGCRYGDPQQFSVSLGYRF